MRPPTRPASLRRLELALDRGDLQVAARFAEQAEALNVPDNAFAPNEIRPWQMSLEVNRAIVRREGVVPASGVDPASEPRYPVAQSVYNPASDNTRLVPAAATSQQSILSRPPQPNEPGPMQPGAQPNPVPPARVSDSIEEGLQALQARTERLRCKNSPKPGSFRTSSIPRRGSSSKTS